MSTSIGRAGGYLVIDHSNSPGIPDDLAAQWAARGTAVAPGSVKLEADTHTCAHCQVIVVRNPNRTRPREVCRRCMHIVCDRPSCVMECQPFDVITERVLAGRSVNIDPVTRLLLPSGAR